MDNSGNSEISQAPENESLNFNTLVDSSRELFLATPNKAEMNNGKLTLRPYRLDDLISDVVKLTGDTPYNLKRLFRSAIDSSNSHLDDLPALLADNYLEDIDTIDKLKSLIIQDILQEQLELKYPELVEEERRRVSPK